MIERFKELILAADKHALRHGTIPEPMAAETSDCFSAALSHLNRKTRNGGPLGEADRKQLGAHAQRELLPYLLLTRTAERMYAKPRGYAGDFLTIDWMYANEPNGIGRIGPLVDRCFLDTPAAQAVRNRRSLLAENIREVVAGANGRPARVTSMACGPAAEIFDVLAAPKDARRLQATVIDIDAEALAFVRNRGGGLGLGNRLTLIQGNLVSLARGRDHLDLAEQDLIYSIGLIDYFHDKFVIALLDYVHSLLRPGGKVILGNFHTCNPDRAAMDYLLDWKLIHRSEDDMNRLFEASRFGRPCANIRFEPAGVNMFAEAVK